MTVRVSRKRQSSLSIRGAGLVLHPNQGIASSYQAGLLEFNRVLFHCIHQELYQALSQYQDGRSFDHPFQTFLRDVFQKVKAATAVYLETKGKQLISRFLDQSQVYTDHSVSLSLKTLGLVQPRLEYNRAVQKIVGSTQKTNATLITSISDETQVFLYERIMQSLTSDKSEAQGQVGILNALKEAGIKNRSRIKLIANDQTSKLYSALSNARLDQNEIEDIQWLHSGAGKTFRPTHFARNLKSFKRNDPAFWEGKRSDQGPPGWAINCRCTALPIIR